MSETFITRCEYVSFIGYVKADPGYILLGGSTTHISSRFETHDDAYLWAASVVETNRNVGRLCTAVIQLSKKRPEIYKTL
jgi:hypothetical protein